MSALTVRLATAPPYLVPSKGDSELFSEIEYEVLRKVAERPYQTMDSVLARVQGNALGAVLHLVSEGYMELVAIAYAWGIEYALALTDKAEKQIQETV